MTVTTDRSFTFTAPARALTENQRLHWAQRARLVRAWRTTTAWQALSAYGRLDPMSPSTVDIAIPVRTAHKRDPHNWTPTCKAIVDGLVDAGWWPDDNSDWVTVLEPVLVVGAPHVTVTARPR